MKNLFFTIIFLGMLLMCISLLLANIYLLGLSEIFVIVPTILLILLNFKKS